MIARAGNVDRDDRTSAVFLEERINELEKKGLLAGDRLRELSLHAQIATKVESFVGKIIGAVEKDISASDAESEFLEGNEVPLEMEMSKKVGDRAADVFVCGLALGVAGNARLLSSGRTAGRKGRLRRR